MGRPPRGCRDACTTEIQIESDLITKLGDLKYSYRQDIRDRAAVEANLPGEVRGAQPRTPDRPRIPAPVRRRRHARRGPGYGSVGCAGGQTRLD